MSQIAAVTLVVPDYDEAIAHYCAGLGFDLIEDTDLGGGKRWVLIAPPGSSETRLLLGKASNEAQRAAIGNQAGGRVFLILFTDDFARDHVRFSAAGAVFTEAPRHEAYGTVAVFRDTFGNLWDLLEPKA
ncbi:VOC family protein [Asticcacaulis sp. W401b]|uniref:VOC family protein n=1 Tax=Asticcacaulis sp. W401b TaxID=3388666 RepID=UPI003970CFE4